MSGRRLRQPFRRRPDERGAILVLSTVGVVLAMIFSAMAIDLGFTAQEARRNQKVADLAALDAVRDLTAVDPRADASALRNKFAPGAPNSVNAVRGDLVNRVFTPNPAGEDVEVTVTSPHKDLFPFVAGASSVTRKAVATLQEEAAFSLGSKLATINTTDAGLYNQIFSALLGTTPAINLTALGYQGLAAGSVSLEDLVAANPALGTPDELATGTVSVRDLAEASVDALNNKGDAASIAAATALGNFATKIPSDLHVDMGDFLKVDAPSSPAAASAQMNVFDLITSAGQAAQIANGVNLITVPNLTATIPGLTTSTAKLHLIEAPRIAIGPVRADPSGPQGWATWAQTAQMRVELTTSITIGTCTGLLASCIALNLPIDVSAAKATGSLVDVSCGTPPPPAFKHNSILVDTVGAEARAAATATIKLLGLTVPVPPLLNAYQPIAGGTTTPPLNFDGPAYPTAIQSTAANGLGLATLLTGQLNLLGLNIGLGTLLGQLTTVTNSIDNLILKPLFDSLGLSVGGADVRTLSVDCGTPTLIK